MSDTELYYPADEIVNLTCAVEANPPPVFRWTDEYGRRVKPINISSHVSVIEVRCPDYFLLFSDKVHTNNKFCKQMRLLQK